MKLTSILLYATGICLLACSCKKEDTAADRDPSYTSRISFVLQDNFTFDRLWSLINYADMQDSLTLEGQYTLLAPYNSAFTPMNLHENGDYWELSIPYERSRQLMQYQLISGKLSFRDMPLQENKPYLTHRGTYVYVSKYLEGTDTVTTLNGVRLVTMDNPASNGLIQVLQQLLNVEDFSSVVNAVRNDTSLTLFAAAIERSGLADSLDAANGAFTLLPPVNMACRESGTVLASMSSIAAASPEELKALLNYHVINGRYFTSDLFRKMAAAPQGILMRSGGMVTVSGDPAQFIGIQFSGAGNGGLTAGIPPQSSYRIYEINANLPAGNGVLHKLNRVLLP